MRPPRAVAIVVHDLRQALAAVALEESLGLEVTLVSAPAASRYAGVGFLRAMEERLGREIVTDCGNDAGLVLAGLRAGLQRLLFIGDAAVMARLEDMARQLGGSITASVGLPILHLEAGEDPARALLRLDG